MQMQFRLWRAAAFVSSPIHLLIDAYYTPDYTYYASCGSLRAEGDVPCEDVPWTWYRVYFYRCVESVKRSAGVSLAIKRCQRVRVWDCVPDERTLIHPHLLRRQRRPSCRNTISTTFSHVQPYIAPLLIGWHFKPSTQTWSVGLSSSENLILEACVKSSRSLCCGNRCDKCRNVDRNSKLNFTKNWVIWSTWICLAHCCKHASNALPLPVIRRWSPFH